MSNKYHYLVCSLPYLELEKEAPITADIFLSECGKWLTVREMSVLMNTDVEDFEIKKDDPKIMRDWKFFDLSLRGLLASARASLKGSRQGKIPDEIKDVFDQPDPLMMEKRLAGKRWEYLDESGFGNYFDFNYLMLYLLKLRVIERLSLFDKDKGLAVFKILCEAKYE